MSSIVAIKGFNDVLPTQTAAWRRLEQHLASLMDAYGYQQIRLPIVEQTGLFKRAIGDATDIVEKEMYTFFDKGTPPESLTLRPEGTAGCVRAMLEHNLLRGATPRVWYVGPMFRYEKPQKGRYRQFHQFGVETFGVATPDIDAELILMTARLWKRMGVSEKVQLELNTLGEIDERAAYRTALVEFLTQHKEALDEDSQRRLGTNPLRILDSKVESTQKILENAPKLHDFLQEDSLAHFNQLQEYLTHAGVSFVINQKLVRGLDYYNKTVFEWTTTALGSQGTVCAGGRYDGLVGQLKGKADQSVPAVGFAMGMERLLLLLEQVEQAEVVRDCDVFLVAESAFQGHALVLAEQIRDQFEGLASTIRVKTGSQGSMKSQMKKADQSGAHYAVILGEREWTTQELTVKELATSEQSQVAISELVPFLVKKFEK
ncbi:MULTISPECIES: histidine--tRNA ligase [Acinetobacter]|uniref:Histidine--tRNA ligase n=1 Tax=Acinetobacter baylyi (strain ATCC 33305 / BD413 / ADP1) TaxID=62977 RepID=SYH_ACIAD|nr:MULTISPECIES: histidine--tRNA ligase [Acinetobacter]Q6FEM2.1 RecName: Full=Histidine--tRNA ligase; AltName: Full=Histidyl-tRNA synthetase; Short=HisRS [Acinetobacter baylyi ADP1]ENV52652.1 histidyl-tRNA synthetase [Acinetobacter baylyi DSM 14961 = CIP 107474]KAF2370038.1 histidine--tRNA ligase [Acinetobacter baylyi]KAF2375893.1 histidine--tRNA ligase [Acinetobacter baylyi]KAF2377452.1 histidine--tRNA ligase [Acinetobacter baylyi]KAF2383244.1 histidine--tRNA ligase [Acinetobacter baylyi]